MALELAPRRRAHRAKLAPGFSQVDWMQLTQRAGGAGAMKPMTLEEVRQHNHLEMDVYMAIKGKVYNVTKYMPYHPGGRAILAPYAGDDATVAFEEYHAWVSMGMLDKYLVGYLVPSVKPEQKENDVEGAPKPAQKELTPELAKEQKVSPTKQGGTGFLARLAKRKADKTTSNKSKAAARAAVKDMESRWFKAKLVAREVDSECRSCAFVRLILDKSKVTPEALQALTQPGAYIKLRKPIGGTVVERPFTTFLSGTNSSQAIGQQRAPLPSACEEEPSILLYVKGYRDGQMTKVLLTGELGAEFALEVRTSSVTCTIDEEQRLNVNMSGAAAFRKAKDPPQHVCMIAQGTGVMPMTQVLEFVARNKATVKSVPTLSLVCVNRSPSSIPFKAILESSPFLVKVTHILGGQTQANSDPKSSLDNHIKNAFPNTLEKSSSILPGIRFLICGSYDFNLETQRLLTELGWPSNVVFRYE
mmetsp:Transcript_21080/g.37332  ORF Transcript_21080/g.37332 Transcript_21080/m.37332 type:complete len:474 (-) Transcript_21080:169-1590(-)|eukprot:CAMPEP_0184546424 /NCGR_PEP_ID=MMETSP0199_2-20130426/4950_1 /TAXON_ID=1112570 /ORGANISM="Thraustochytrium sp., Strain LLF1b" /LENGTH=473 /DNA_ID=CAMNT_0026940831 /DNA_START=169 /DNA_END=1590 /DNA_ORIENTATION=-